LVERLTSEDPDTVSWAVSAITKIGPPARPAAEGLRALLRHGDNSVRTQAANALASVGVEDPAELSGDLEAALRARDYDTAALLIIAIRECGLTRLCFVQVYNCLSCDHERVGEEALKALHGLGLDVRVTRRNGQIHIKSYLPGALAAEQWEWVCKQPRADSRMRSDVIDETTVI
jgi:HEAT repeat protein